MFDGVETTERLSADVVAASSARTIAASVRIIGRSNPVNGSGCTPVAGSPSLVFGIGTSIPVSGPRVFTHAGGTHRTVR
jgi:hypothetical protein